MKNWEQQIDEDFDWRFAEIASIKVEYLKSPEKSIHRTALLRALWVMLYAHYEGFCKATWDLFLDAIESEKIECGVLKDNLSIASLKSELKRLKNSASDLELYKFCVAGFQEKLNSPAKFSDRYKRISNLPPEEYRRICEQFCLPTDAVNKNHSKLQRLVYFRHAIAHGEKLIHDKLEEYKEYEDAVSEVMVELALAVISALQNRSYCK